VRKAGERARSAAEGDGVEIGEDESGGAHQPLDAGQQRRRRRRQAVARRVLVDPDDTTGEEGDAAAVGARVEGEDRGHGAGRRRARGSVAAASADVTRCTGPAPRPCEGATRLHAMIGRWPFESRCVLAWLGCLGALCALPVAAAIAADAGTGRPASFRSRPVPAASLPATVEAALQRAGVPREAIAVFVQDVDAARPRLAWQAERPMNPASLNKLVTTYAALDLLGPAWTWTTPVWIRGTLLDGVLEGDVVVKGTGDPKLVLERVWLLLRRLQQAGVRDIRGDIVVDRTAFRPGEHDPSQFDNEPLRPQNSGADAFLVNFKAVVLTFTPDWSRGVAFVGVDPPLAGVRADTTVPLSSIPCDDWRGALKADFTDPARIAFAGTYAASCGEKFWPFAHADPKGFHERALAGMWREIGGTLRGRVRDGVAPAGVAPTFELRSPSLAEVVRDINKASNNVMAQQLFLTLGATQRNEGSPDGARRVVQGWLAQKLGPSGATDAIVTTGSGLSREGRLSATQLGRLLAIAWQSPVMPELASSLPVAGLDGTMRRSRSPVGRAHLKTGSLRDVAGVAGYVLGDSGRRSVVVAVINHGNANAARPALDAVVEWASADAAARR
jgi:D-alanyl-D-alanine carboxypeptidase/D-alanyl-D-alanine-endopeptidase (penicillin-binding protein 4)